METNGRGSVRGDEEGSGNGARRTAVVLDPHPLWLNAVDFILEGVEVDTLGCVTTSAEAYELIRTHRPELFVTEFELREDDVAGAACVAHARALQPTLRVIVLAELDDQGAIAEAFAAGAAAYVLKSARPEDLASAVRQSFEPSVYLAAAPVEARAPVEQSAHAAGLTRRELEILQLVSDGHSNAHLARMLWVSEQTVKFHLSNIYRKLDVANRTEAARWAQLHGLLVPMAQQPPAAQVRVV